MADLLERFIEINRRLSEHYPDPQCPLTHNSPEQLIIAVILSAQTNDNTVNKVTPELFERWPDMASLASAPLKEVEKVLYPTGFYHAKAKNIIGCAREVSEKYGGKIPRDFEMLVKLPGVGRKTANVVMDCAFGVSVGIVVDTHVRRLSNKLGFTTESDPVKIERHLMSWIPKEYWLNISLYLVFHGRKYCMAKQPDCAGCFLNDLCPSSLV